ncbi:MAG: hypothetical protein COB07_08860 [Sulfurovum sp.]|nr:MAG: hypothetical protein COB07_08860 [Sulfurovum sp.]
MSEDGKIIISGSGDNTIKIWDSANGTLLKTLKGHEDPVSSVAISEDGKTIISGSWDQTIKIWDSASGTLLNTLKGHEDRVKSVAISKDGKTIISGSYKTIKIWDRESGKILKTLEGHTSSVNSVAISKDGKTIISGSGDNTIKIWDISQKNTEENLKNLEQQLQVRLEGITLVPTEIPYNKVIWSKQHPNHWLNKAKNGDSEAMYQLALIYDRDNKNLKALEWYKKSASAGHKAAKERVAFLHKWMQSNKKEDEMGGESTGHKNLP